MLRYERYESPENEDEEMSEIIPCTATRRGRRRRVRDHTAVDDIMRQNLNDKSSYSYANTTVEAQAEQERNFIGDAMYYLLDRKRVRNRLALKMGANNGDRLERKSMVPT